MDSPPPVIQRIFSRSTWPDTKFVADALRTETVGGLLLIVGAAIALVWSNSPWRDGYEALRGTVIGPSALNLDLDLATWAADGLLAIFFFVVGVELKRELMAGNLRDPRKAALPIVAACGGAIVPAMIFAVINASDPEALRGWAIPMATDIAFALAVLAVIGTNLPSALRIFLLTLAVVDDLVAITVIAIFYTDDLAPLPLLGALVPIAVFAALVQRHRLWWWALMPLSVLTWVLVHESGVHATIAGIVLGLTVPVLRQGQSGRCTAERLEHRWRPLSAGVAVPVFAFFAAGVSVADAGGVAAIADDAVAVGIVAGLVLGKVVGVLGTTWLLARFTRAELDDDLAWSDVLGLSMLAGIGFTVSLLVAELAYAGDDERLDHARVAVLVASVVAALLAAIVLRTRNRVYRRIAELESRDDDADGIPDVYQYSHAREG